MSEVVQVRVQINGGKPYYYPFNATALGLAQLLQQKTLTARDLDCLKTIGYKVEVLGAKLQDK